MKVKYDIDKAKTIIENLERLTCELISTDKEYLIELESISSIYESESGKIFFKKIIEDYNKYYELLSAFCNAFTVLKEIQVVHEEAYENVQDVLVKVREVT